MHKDPTTEYPIPHLSICCPGEFRLFRIEKLPTCPPSGRSQASARKPPRASLTIG